MVWFIVVRLAGNGIHKLRERWENVTASVGQYFEKYNLNLFFFFLNKCSNFEKKPVYKYIPNNISFG